MNKKYTAYQKRILEVIKHKGDCRKVVMSCKGCIVPPKKRIYYYRDPSTNKRHRRTEYSCSLHEFDSIKELYNKALRLAIIYLEEEDYFDLLL